MVEDNECSLPEIALAADEVGVFIDAGRNAGVPISATLIEIEREVSAGFLHGRQDVWVRGRVIADELVEQVSLQVGRQTVGNVFYGRGGALTTHKSTGGSLAKQCGFAFNLRRPAIEAALSCQFAITARGGAWTTSEKFILGSDNDIACRIVEGRTSTDATCIRAPIFLYVERATIGQDTQLRIEGWVLSAWPIVTIQVFSDERRIGVAQFGRTRADVAKAHPDYPNPESSGFVFSARLGAESSRISHVRIEAVSSDGTTQEAFCTVTLAQPPLLALTAERMSLRAPGPPPDARRQIQMCIDQATLGKDGQLAVTGWAFCGVGIARVEVLLDGQPVGEAEVALPREDVAQAHPAIPMARYAGFRLAHNTLRKATGLTTLQRRRSMVWAICTARRCPRRLKRPAQNSGS